MRRGLAEGKRPIVHVEAIPAPPGGVGGRAAVVEASMLRSFHPCFHLPNACPRNGAAKNGFIRTDNYRARVLEKLAEDLDVAKLSFQVLRRTIATLAQRKGNVKDVLGILGHMKADTTVNVYMQQIDEGVKRTLDAIYAELTARPRRVAVS